MGYGFQQLSEVLIKTDYLSSANLAETYRRLMETTQMVVHAVIGDVDDFDRTFLDVIRVRLLHGMVRYKLKKYKQQVPINQEDLLVTLLSFSYCVLKCMEQQIGISICEEDREAYLHFWRYIGWLSGIQDEYLHYHSSRVVYESIFYHFYHPTPISKHLAYHNIRSVYEDVSTSMSFQFYLGLSQRLLGEEVSQGLDLDQLKLDFMHRSSIHIMFQSFRFYSWILKLNISLIDECMLRINRRTLMKLVEKYLRNFALFKSYRTNSIAIERKSSKDCSCGFYQKKNEGMIMTNDMGPVKMKVFLLLQALCFILS